jgi:hypothetical protein
LVHTKEDLEKKLKSLEERLPKILEKIKSAPVTAEIERDEKKYTIKPRSVAKKSARKVSKKIFQLKKLIAKAS